MATQKKKQKKMIKNKMFFKAHLFLAYHISYIDIISNNVW